MHFYVLKNAPAFIFLENLGQHIFFFRNLLTFNSNIYSWKLPFCAINNNSELSDLKDRLGYHRTSCHHTRAEIGARIAIGDVGQPNSLVFLDGIAMWRSIVAFFLRMIRNNEYQKACRRDQVRTIYHLLCKIETGALARSATRSLLLVPP